MSFIIGQEDHSDLINYSLSTSKNVTIRRNTTVDLCFIGVFSFYCVIETINERKDVLAIDSEKI